MSKEENPQKILLRSRGWIEVLPGIYIAEEKTQSHSLENSNTVKAKNWVEKFEEYQPNAYRIFLEKELTELDLEEEKLDDTFDSEIDNLEVKQFF